MFLALFGSTQSATFQCNYFISGGWGSLGKIYVCFVQNSIYITSLDTAHVDFIFGKHQADYNNDNVDAISVYYKSKVHYFPRGLNKIFKNLKGIEIQSTGLKEIHQSDLRDLPKLMNLYLWNSNLEIIEENLFEFNPNLESIFLPYNRISHINPNVFDNLFKLKYLYLGSNTCINMKAENNSAAVQNVIKTAQAQCTNLDYSNLEQKVKYLEIGAKILNSSDLKKELENLKNEIKNSTFPNFFQEKLQSLNATVIEKDTFSGINKMMKLIINSFNAFGNVFSAGNQGI